MGDTDERRARDRARRQVRSRIAVAVLLLVASSAWAAPEPDYSEWNRLLAHYYEPARGMDYGRLEADDAAAIQSLRESLGRVDVRSLPPKQQLAYWINLYNVNVVAIVVDRYPVASIRDISTDPIVRLNVFKKDSVPFGGSMISLDTIENAKIRAAFRDPRIHFAINCAAKSCPPIRPEAFVGEHLDEQLDDQVRKFANGPGLRIENRGGRTVVHTTKIMDWFRSDFAGGTIAFLRPYLPAEKARLLPASGKVTIEYDDYDWSLNDWKR